MNLLESIKKILKVSRKSQIEPESLDKDYLKYLELLKKHHQLEQFYLSFSKNTNNMPTKIDYSKITFLVVDDYLLFIEFHCDIIEKLGAKYMIAENESDALKIFQDSKIGSIDVILTDVYMDCMSMSGIELSKKIRNMNREDARTVVILGVSAENNEERVLKAGMNGHMQKLINTNLLDLYLQILPKRNKRM